MSAATHAAQPMAQIQIRPEGDDEVTVAHLTNELGRLWAHVTEQVEQAAGHPPVHTSILTLVIVARGASELRTATTTLHELAENQPSRAVVIEITRAGGQLGADLSAHCKLQDPSRPTCYDVIQLRAPHDQLQALPSLLEPLQLPDIPVFLWWVGEVDFDAPEFTRLTRMSERMIIDSASFEDASTALLDYARYMRANEANCTVTELNWARSTSWRELIAQSFDHPVTRPLLDAVQHIEIDYDTVAEAQALLLVGWIGSRLGWTPVAARRSGATMSLTARNRAGAAVNMDLNRQSSAGVGLRAVRLLAARGQEGTRITVRRRSADLAAVSIETAGMPRQERIVHDARARLADLIGSELLVQSRERVFEEALGCAAEFLEMLEGGDGTDHR
jgi:glucose-6-phosphate dehydrogenase assembly protein OpcA